MVISSVSIEAPLRKSDSNPFYHRDIPGGFSSIDNKKQKADVNKGLLFAAGI
jgi:hypothetical protein